MALSPLVSSDFWSLYWPPPVSQLCSYQGLGLTGGLPARALSTHLYVSSSPCLCPQCRPLLASTHQIPCLDVPRCPGVTAKRDSSSFTPVTPPKGVPAARVPAAGHQAHERAGSLGLCFPSFSPAGRCLPCSVPGLRQHLLLFIRVPMDSVCIIGIASSPATHPCLPGPVDGEQS